MPLKYRRIFLRTNIMLYLLPIPWLCAELKGGVQWILSNLGILLPETEISYITDITNVWNSVFIVNEKGKILYITGYQKLFLGIMAGSVFSIIMILGWLILYWKICRKYKRKVDYIEISNYVKCNKMIRKRILIGFSSEVSSPVAIGIIRPIILFPLRNEQYANSIEEIIYHELEHIKSMDIISRFLTFIVIVTGWFNPLAYFVFRENITVSEMLCDEEALKGRAKAEKADYIRCIIVAAQESAHLGISVVSFGVRKKLIKERIERIMGKKQKRIWKRNLALAIMVVCFIISSIPALAYKKPVEWTISSQSGAGSWGNTDLVVFADEGEWEDSQIDFSQSDIIFVSDEGTVFYNNCLNKEVNEQNNVERICAHSYKSGTISQHIKGADDSCVVAVYNAQQCVRCGNIIYGSEISRITYQPCIH